MKFRRKTEVGSAPASPSLYLKYKCPEDGLHLKCKRAECWGDRRYRSQLSGWVRVVTDGPPGYLGRTTFFGQDLGQA